MGNPTWSNVWEPWLRLLFISPPSQKRALARRAKQRQTTMSKEIRAALDKHVNDGQDGEDEAQLTLLAGKANKAIERMIRKLDEAHASFVQLCKTFARRRP